MHQENIEDLCEKAFKGSSMIRQVDTSLDLHNIESFCKKALLSKVT